MCPQEHIEASLDRWTEAHWHIHQMEEHFHVPDLFRYSLNAFVRSLKEIPQILTMELQNQPEYQKQFKPAIDELNQDPLFCVFRQKRDFIVHRGTLRLHSSGSVGTTEGRGFKIGFPLRVSPDESSDEAYARFMELCRRDEYFPNLLRPDCDSRLASGGHGEFPKLKTRTYWMYA